MGDVVTDLHVRSGAIEGLLVVALPVHGDARGWFKENWQREKMVALGLPDFGPVQHSMAFNAEAGVTRGIHAEPWDKYVSVGHGRAFGAWVDLRVGPGFGTVHTEILDPGTAVFVPRGVGNAYQTLEPETVYTYLVNEHWSPDAAYTHLNLADETAAVPWPIALDGAVISDKDRHHPQLADVDPVRPRTTVILGAEGQLGSALRTLLPEARAVFLEDLDFTDPQAVEDFDLGDPGLIVNAAAYTAVDASETAEGREAAWAINAAAVRTLARKAVRHRSTLVHFSTDYVFDGTGGSGPGGTYRETDPIAPLGVYGQSKAAGELAAATASAHYVLRTSWLIGNGANFVGTMRSLARRGVSPAVVDDQIGRLTFADDLARAALHLVEHGAPYGVYHVSNAGEAQSWADVARRVFEAEGRDPGDVTGVSTEEYFAGRTDPIAPRPRLSALDTGRLDATGWSMPSQDEALAAYLQRSA